MVHNHTQGVSAHLTLKKDKKKEQNKNYDIENIKYFLLEVLEEIPNISMNSRVMYELASTCGKLLTHFPLWKSYHSTPLLPTGPLTSHCSVLVWCGLKWLDQGVLSRGPSVGWFLIQLGLRGSGVSRLGWAGCAKWGFYLPWGNPTLMDRGKWIHEEEWQGRLLKPEDKEGQRQ